MNFFWSLFSSRPTFRHYARVDANGICRAFKHCSEAPASSGWIEIREQNLGWMNQPLPASARVIQRTARPAARQLRIA